MPLRRSVPQHAAFCRVSSATPRHCLPLFHLLKLRVAGSNPVSRFKIHAASRAVSGLAAFHLGDPSCFDLLR